MISLALGGLQVGKYKHQGGPWRTSFHRVKPIALCNYREWAPNPEKEWRWNLRNASPEEVGSKRDVMMHRSYTGEAEKEPHPRKGKQYLRA